ncbi:Hypothetical predicted protein [Mytilus galloprovincialis]|uniref:Apple domain-containing protein n=1 Tax=Mytilus galloprovincialis TaxID=29158 RepID=A0A8B6D9F9_MYTGA|nr:Hypothetical predicted protein [Mytilus galloprovincialis]
MDMDSAMRLSTCIKAPTGEINHIADIMNISTNHVLECSRECMTRENCTFFVYSKQEQKCGLYKDDEEHGNVIECSQGMFCYFVWDGDTLLHSATRFGHLNILQWLLERTKIDPNNVNKDGDTVLHITVRGGKLEMVKLLLKTSTIDPNQQNKTNGDTLLHIAVRDENLDMVQLLLERGDIDPDKVNKISRRLMVVGDALNLGLFSLMILEGKATAAAFFKQLPRN